MIGLALSLLITAAPEGLTTTIWQDIGGVRVIPRGELPFCDVSKNRNFEIEIPMGLDDIWVVATNQAGDMKVVWPNNMTSRRISRGGRLRLTAEEVFTHSPPVTDSLVLHIFELDATAKKKLASIIANRTVRTRRRLGDDRRFSEADLQLFQFQPAHQAIVIENPDFPKLTSHFSAETRAKIHLKRAAFAQRAGDYPRGLAAANAAVAEIERAFPREYFPNGHEDIAVMLLRQADSLVVTGEFDRAKACLQRTRDITERAFRNKHSDARNVVMGSYFFYLAKLQFMSAEYESCLDSATKCRAEFGDLGSEVLTPMAYECMTSVYALEVLAVSLLQKDNPDVPEQWASVIQQSKRGDAIPAVVRDRTQATVLLMYGDHLANIGQYQKAIEVCERAVSLASRLPLEEGVDLAAEARLVSARAHVATGAFADGLLHLNDAWDRFLPFREKNEFLSQNHALEFFRILAECSFHLSDRKLLDGYTPHVERQLSQFHPKRRGQCYAYVYASLAMAAVSRERGDVADSLRVIRRGIDRAKDHLVESDSWVVGVANLHLADSELQMGRTSTAKIALRNSRILYDRPPSSFVHRALLMEIKIANAVGDPAAAMSLIAECEALEKQTEISTLNRLQAAKLARVIFLESGQHDKAAEYAQKAFDLYLEHLEQLVSETSSSEYQRKKRVARVILDALLADGIEVKVSPDELRRAVRRYYETEFAIAPAKQGEQDELLTRQRELESIWQASLLKSPLIGKAEEQNAALLEIARLERGTLFIPKSPERNGTQHAERQTEWLVHRMQNGEHSFLVLFHQNEDGETEMVLIEMKAFEERLSGWRKSLVNNNESQDDLLWISRQLSPLLNNVHEHLQIVGDPVAYEVPWSALLVGEQRLVERASVAVSHAPSAKRPQTKINRSSAVLLVGDVRFPSEGPLEPLPFSREEVLRIATHFESPKLALGATPTRKWTLDMLAESEVAHLATHGIGRSTVRNLGQGNSPLLGEAPFLGSGLLLAGASARQADLLTAATVASLKLPQLKLVVLSSCESGVTAGSEAAYALPRAFHLAGCQTVVSTQWPVDDLATSVLMQLFYANLVAEQMKPAEAMRQAQLTVLRNPGRLDELAKLRGPDFTQAAKRLNKNAGTKAKIASPRLWAGFIVSHGGGRWAVTR